jgi:hypothetical protein
VTCRCPTRPRREQHVSSSRRVTRPSAHITFDLLSTLFVLLRDRLETFEKRADRFLIEPRRDTTSDSRTSHDRCHSIDSIPSRQSSRELRLVRRRRCRSHCSSSWQEKCCASSIFDGVFHNENVNEARRERKRRPAETTTTTPDEERSFFFFFFFCFFFCFFAFVFVGVAFPLYCSLFFD